MIISDAQWEENFQEYLRLLKDPNYYDVTFDEESGGVSAIHREHKFDTQMGISGIKKGNYEIIAMDILMKRGHCVILESELAPNGVKTPDGSLDSVVMEIKAVEKNGKWTIKDKFHNATKQGAECVILYFHKKVLFSEESICDGWTKFLQDKDSQRYNCTIKRVLCVVENEVVEWMLPI